MPHAFPLGEAQTVSDSKDMTIIDMDERRRRRQEKTEEVSEEYAGRVCPCGQAWFMFRNGLGLITLATDGRVTGYHGKLICSSCGTGL